MKSTELQKTLGIKLRISIPKPGDIKIWPGLEWLNYKDNKGGLWVFSGKKREELEPLSGIEPLTY